MEFVFWQNILSPHQSPFIRALAEQGHEVTLVTVETMTPDRLALGWKVPDLGPARIIVGPADSEIPKLVESSSTDAIHIIAGARWTPLGDRAVQLCLVSNRRMGIITEAPDPRGLAGTARWFKYTKERWQRVRHYDFVLAMGEMGARWFRGCGYPAPKLFPFAYVTEPLPLAPAPEAEEQHGLLYVGQFIARKGLDILLRAFAGLPSSPARLRLMGDGPEKLQLVELARELGIQERVSWLTKSDTAGVQMAMARTDVTVLPSRHDGWGAVVNESLQMGTPVICSTACGAAELIRQPWLGTVFRSGSVPELSRALKVWIEKGPRSDLERERIRNWANCISGEVTAQYFTEVLEHVYHHATVPIAPWRRRGETQI